jgi:hypothetical protein
MDLVKKVEACNSDKKLHSCDRRENEKNENDDKTNETTGRETATKVRIVT